MLPIHSAGSDCSLPSGKCAVWVYAVVHASVSLPDISLCGGIVPGRGASAPSITYICDVWLRSAESQCITIMSPPTCSDRFQVHQVRVFWQPFWDLIFRENTVYCACLATERSPSREVRVFYHSLRNTSIEKRKVNGRPKAQVAPTIIVILPQMCCHDSSSRPGRTEGAPRGQLDWHLLPAQWLRLHPEGSASVLSVQTFSPIINSGTRFTQ